MSAVGWERRPWIVVRRSMAVVSLPAVMLEVVHAVSALGKLLVFISLEAPVVSPK